MYFCLEFQFRTGMPLETLIGDCAFYAAQFREVKMFKILALLRNLWQTALFLSGANEFDGTFTGDIVRQEPELAVAGDFRDYLWIAIHRTLMYTQFVLGNHKLVYESIKNTEMDNNGYEKGFPGIAGKFKRRVGLSVSIKLNDRGLPKIPTARRHIPSLRIQRLLDDCTVPRNQGQEVFEDGQEVCIQNQELGRRRGTQKQW
jgi:hypothetical protein